MKDLITYLTFNGNCRAAMTFYKKCLGADLDMKAFSEIPGDHPKGAGDRIVHARLAKGSAVLMASDALPGAPFQQGSNFSISVNCDSVPEQEKLFAALGEGGRALLPLQDTFWGARFGMLQDQFGIQWMLNAEKK